MKADCHQWLPSDKLCKRHAEILQGSAIKGASHRPGRRHKACKTLTSGHSMLAAHMHRQSWQQSELSTDWHGLKHKEAGGLPGLLQAQESELVKACKLSGLVPTPCLISPSSCYLCHYNQKLHP